MRRKILKELVYFKEPSQVNKSDTRKIRSDVDWQSAAANLWLDGIFGF